MSDRELLQQCLETLESLQGGCTDHDDGTVEAITVWCPELIDALRAALAQPESEPVMWQYRWTNPGNNPNVGPEELEWGPLELKGRTEEETLRDLFAYKFNGRPCYEVRPLYATPQAQPATVPDGWVMVPREPSSDSLHAGVNIVIGNQIDCLTWDECKKLYRAMVAAVPAVPAVREPLTDEQIDALWRAPMSADLDHREFARAIEAHHGITGDSK